MKEVSLYVENYKCFDVFSGFDSICRMNLIVGRNNSGKSSLVEALSFVCESDALPDSDSFRGGQTPEIELSAEIPVGWINRVFSDRTSGGHIRGNHRHYGNQYLGRRVVWTKQLKKGARNVLKKIDDEGISPPFRQLTNQKTDFENLLSIDLENKVMRRLLAERDVYPETASRDSTSIKSNGVGLTNTIQQFINSSTMDSKLIEIDLLGDLNRVFVPDGRFTDIVCQQHEDGSWEIYLEEESKGRIALSKSGSGLKTILLVLSMILLDPVLSGKPLSSYVFAFEELENNLHPALLRRLVGYIYDHAKDSDFFCFLTTHSNVMIDQFSTQDDAQIVHVSSDGKRSWTQTVSTYVDTGGILDDLDIRASDLLQSNGIIWVEGPSDRIYINQWIDLRSDGSLREGTHYQIVFYGGRLLSHMTASSGEELSPYINILLSNRNAAVVIDSDKRAAQTPINETKKRIQKECGNVGVLCWITKGREIENYLPKDIAFHLIGSEPSRDLDQYESFFEYLDEFEPEAGRKLLKKKYQLAEDVRTYISADSIDETLDLGARIDELCVAIRKWNSIV